MATEFGSSTRTPPVSPEASALPSSLERAEHMPGPLMVHRQPAGDEIDHEYSIMTETGPPVVLALINLVAGTRADLRVWAAAPDLLEALSALLFNTVPHATDAFIDAYGDETREALERLESQARAALAKARPADEGGK